MRPAVAGCMRGTTSAQLPYTAGIAQLPLPCTARSLVCLALLVLLGGMPHKGAAAQGAVLGDGSANEPLSRASRAPTHAALAEARDAAKHAARLAWAGTWGEYREYHAAALRRVEEMGSLGTDRFLVCVFQTGLGWGNRLTPIFTSAIIALLTDRVLLVRISKEGLAWSDEVPVWEYLEPQLPLKVSPALAMLLDRAGTGDLMTEISKGKRVTSIDWNGGMRSGGMHRGGPQVLNYVSSDYLMDLLKVNPRLAQPLGGSSGPGFFDTYWPDGEVAKHLWRDLLRPAPTLEARMRVVVEEEMAGHFVVGVQIRSKKPWPRGERAHFVLTDFFKAAEMAAHKRGFTGSRVRFFIAGDAPEVYTQTPECASVSLATHQKCSRGFKAGDAPEVYKQAEDYFGSHRMIRTDNGVGDEATPQAGNPGNEASGLTDLMLLTMCDDLVLSWASSFGSLAAGISGVTPIFVWPAAPEPPGPFKMERVSRALSSEPVFSNAPWFIMAAEEGDRMRYLNHPESLRLYGSSGPGEWGNSTLDVQ
ncbi:hypothetical protein FOA52_012650 [Chlamydomonas sp. UWO 241]|nr:hypothetical protein FOA52_012650 [Chlamydomonas sp. UWO 241]